MDDFINKYKNKTTNFHMITNIKANVKNTN